MRISFDLSRVCLEGGIVCCCSFTKKAINDGWDKSTAKENQDHLEFVADKLVLLWDKTKTEGEFMSLSSM